MKKYLSLLTIFAMLFSMLPLTALAAQAADDDLGTITEYTIPTGNSIPMDIVAGPDGALWFTEGNAGKIGRITVPAGDGGSSSADTQTVESATALLTSAALNPVEGVDTNIITKAQSIVDAVYSGVTVTLGSSSNTQIAASGGEITYGTSIVTGNVTFNLTKNSATGTQIVSIIVPASTGENPIAVDTGIITEYSVPTGNSGPAGIAAGPDGNMWFTEMAANKIGSITVSGAVYEYSVSGTPYLIVAGPDDAMWFIQPEDNKIGRITMDGTATDYTIPSEYGGSFGIAAGLDDDLWFTEPEAGKIGRITTNGVITEYTVQIHEGALTDIAAGADGAMWFTNGGSNKIGRITTSGAETEYPLPTDDGDTFDIAAGPDGALWFTEQEANKIGKITMDGTITEYPIPTSESSPSLIAAGPDNAMWFTEPEVDKIGRITMDGTITEFSIPTEKGYPAGIVAGPDGNMWFTEYEANTIGKLSTTALVAAGITSVIAPAADSTSLTMPTVPSDYTIAIASSSSTNVIAANGMITSPAIATTVNLTFTVTNISNHSTAITASIPVTVPAVSNGNGNNSSHNDSSHDDSSTTITAPVVAPVNTGVEILVNGKAENAGTTATTASGSQTVTTITVDSKKLGQKLESEGSGYVVTIPVGAKSDVVVGVLTGDMVKNMEVKQAILEIKTDSAYYTLPAQQINIDDVSAQLGTSIALKDIQVKVEISKPTAEAVRAVEDSANKGSFTIVAQPVEFNVSCSYGGRTVTVSSFRDYVERTIAIPEGVDPGKITTGVVVEPDGTVRHVPTKIVLIEGKYYAKINSLTNSIYSVVWHPLEFEDVVTNWAKDSINDMGSRTIVTGVGNSNYEPDRDITRAEFAAIIVRALGLAPGTGKNGFSDIKTSEWYCGYIETASKYGIIQGYNTSTFGPNDIITREQAMTMIARAMKITGLSSELKESEISTLLLNYSDGTVASDYAKTSIAACLKTGIITGRSSNTIAPKNFITRAEVAVIVQRLLQKSDLI